jgi:hypothetical protein
VAKCCRCRSWTWRDDSVEFTVIVYTDAKPMGSYLLIDRNLDREQAEVECLQSPPKVKPAPRIRSFFNR